MNYHRAIVQYDGTGYAGFQWQNTGATIQSDINQALAKIVTGQFTTAGASRTDTGVHAVEQIVKISTEETILDEAHVEIFNRYLPAQIRCLSLVSIPENFYPTTDTTSKEYRYLFTNKTDFVIDERRFISNLANKLESDLMQACIELLIGRHDFANFCSTGTNVKTTVREILEIDLTMINPHDLFSQSELFRMPAGLQSCYQLRVVASGFLKQMIRHLVSAIWMVGSRRISVEQFKAYLDGPKVDSQLWKVAPARGLFLYRFNY